MQILTRARRIRNALRVVLARLPAKDRQRITAFITRVGTDTAWNLGLCGVPAEQTSGGLFPLYDGLNMAAPPKGQLRFSLPVCRLFTDRALVGVVAHEMAHALRASTMGPQWLERMGGTSEIGVEEAGRRCPRGRRDDEDPVGRSDIASEGGG